jgi:hypothetical protein
MMDKHDFEKYPPEMRKDETDVNVRAYFALMDDAKLAQYDPNWTDEQLMEWDGNFKSDGSLMLICSERDVEVAEYRQVLEQFLEFQKR